MLKSLRPREIQEFRLQWDNKYKECSYDPIQATFELYTGVLPINCQEKPRETIRLSTCRQEEFIEKADEKNVRFLVQFGLTLDELLDKKIETIN